MADSLTTKKALAKALKDLTKDSALEKISIGEICAQCGLNRKSFYYHFKDKYDLVNWIFDTEFLSVAAGRVYNKRLDAIEDLCSYLYENKSFYKKALMINDINSFSNHLKEVIEPLIKMRLQDVSQDSDITRFQLNFYTDAFIFTIGRWLVSSECLEPKKFIEGLKSCIYITATDAVKEMDNQ